MAVENKSMVVENKPVTLMNAPFYVGDEMPPYHELGHSILKVLEQNRDSFPGEPLHVVPGSHPVFSKGELHSKMESEPGEYKGTASSIFMLNLGQDAIPGVPANKHDIEKYRQDHFTKVPHDATIHWEHAVTVAVTQDVLEQIGRAEGQAPAFRKVSMDVMVYAFLAEFWHRLQHLDAGLVPLNFWMAARHVPVNFKYFEPHAELEQHIYVYSMQIMEDFRIAEAVHAPRAWQLCQYWARAKEMSSTDLEVEDGAEGVAKILAKVTYSAHCDYVDKGTQRINKRMVADALIFHERAVAANIGDWLDMAGSQFGPRSPLTQMSKLVKLSQLSQAAAQARKVNLSYLLSRTVQVLFIRLTLGVTPVGEGLTTLAKTEFPRSILIAELLTEAASNINLEQERREIVDMCSLITVNGVLPQGPSVLEKLVPASSKPSTRTSLSWMQTLLAGNLDDAVKEIVHQNLKSKPVHELLGHPKLGWKDGPQAKLHLEKEEAKKKKLANIADEHGVKDTMGFLSSLMEDTVSQDSKGAAQDKVLEGLADGEDEAEDLEHKEPELEEEDQLQLARRLYAKGLLDQYIKLAERPSLEDSDAWPRLIADLTSSFFDQARDGARFHVGSRILPQTQSPHCRAESQCGQEARSSRRHLPSASFAQPLG